MSDLIAETHAFRSENLTSIEYDDQEAIRQLLLGHRVDKIADDHLRLDDGTVVRVVPNDGGCACGAGDYELDSLNGCDNVITAVDVAEESHDKYGESRTYSVFVVAEDKRMNLFAVSGDDGNGYYGTGYRILVRRP